MTTILTVFLLLALVGPHAAHAVDIYVCRDPAAPISFQQEPCARGQAQEFRGDSGNEDNQLPTLAKTGEAERPLRIPDPERWRKSW